ncbi:hypothetical protein Tco_1035184 [Tanacetum coccineum]
MKCLEASSWCLKKLSMKKLEILKINIKFRGGLLGLKVFLKLLLLRPKFDKDSKFELKGQFLKELRDNTFIGSENDDTNKHIERVLKIVDLFTTPDVTRDQLMLRVFPITLTGAASREIKKVNERVYSAQVGYELCNGPRYTKDCQLKEEGKTLEEAYYTQFRVLFPNAGRRFNQSIRDSTWANKQGTSKRGSGSLPSSTETNLRDHVKAITTTKEAETSSIRRIKS